MSETKICTKCGAEKPATAEYFFVKSMGRGGLRAACKRCEADNQRAYVALNRDRVRRTAAEWNFKNQARVAETNRIWASQHRDNRRATVARWRKRNPTWSRDYMRRRRREDAQFRLLNNLRVRLWNTVRVRVKCSSVLVLLGCSLSEFKCLIGAKFSAGMCWGNYGEWELDHIIPCRAFNLSDTEEQRICFSYLNFQPLWRRDNRMKTGTFPVWDRLPVELQSLCSPRIKELLQRVQKTA